MEEEFQRRGAPHLDLSTTPPMGFTTITDPATGARRPADFKTLLSITWADIMAHPEPEQRRRHQAAGTGVDYAEGIKLTDPRRMAVYFAKYGTAGAKEYQHRVPREWINCYLVCDRDYPEDHDECPDCGCFEAEVVEVGSAGRFWGYRGLRPAIAVREVTPHDDIRTGRILRRWYRAKGLTRRVHRERVDQHTGRISTRVRIVHKTLFPANRGFVTVNDGLRRTLLQDRAGAAINGSGTAPGQGGPPIPGALAPLIEKGVVEAGDTLKHVQPRKRRSFTATIEADGWIRTEVGRYQHPSPALGNLVGTQISGKAYWTHERSGKTLSQLLDESGLN